MPEVTVVRDECDVVIETTLRDQCIGGGDDHGGAGLPSVESLRCSVVRGVIRFVAEDLYTVLVRFHRDVVLPDIERIVDARLDATVTPLRREMLSNFDAVYQRFDRLESETAALKAAVQRLENSSNPSN